MSKAVVLYLHAHQPWRLRHYTVFDCARAQNYFDTDPANDNDNRRVLLKVADKSYKPTNAKLKYLLELYPDFKINLSISGVLLDQLERWAPDVLDSFKQLADSGRLEIAAETYYHSLAFFYDREEFEEQVRLHTPRLRKFSAKLLKCFAIPNSPTIMNWLAGLKAPATVAY
ncbi:MAG TPA: hypothetical protein VFW90_01680 [Candidatus Saccharimonadales bacterium]|nr:hypothetical protein [Candidatus Saccharimonadales bacterium]